jgi:hypothetical protein
VGWNVPQIWKGGDCWIIGGGPSLIQQFKIPEDVVEGVRKNKLPLSAYSPYMKAIHDKHVIGVNQAFRLGDWVDVMMFGDFKFYPKYRDELLKYPGIKVTCHNRFENEKFGDNVKCVPRNNKKGEGLTWKGGQVSWNKNTGAAAINLAVHFGAKRIFLLGFDMQCINGHQHFHNLYFNKQQERSRRDRNVHPFGRHLRGFPKIAQDAKKMGVEIINVSTQSAIMCFPRVTLQEALKMKKMKSNHTKEENMEGATTVSTQSFQSEIDFPFNGGKRFDWLRCLVRRNQFTIGAEVGCFRGKTTAAILAANPQLEVYAVDLWKYMPDIMGEREKRIRKDQNQDLVKKEFDRRTRNFRNRITILRGISWEMAKEVTDESLDFVFIDADHDYEPVKKDIQAWVPKVRKGGVICGHDIHLAGVYRAVNELLPDYKDIGVDDVWALIKK